MFAAIILNHPLKEKETVMDKPMSNFDFQFMSVGYKFRDFFLPRLNILKEVGVNRDFMCSIMAVAPGVT